MKKGGIIAIGIVVAIGVVALVVYYFDLFEFESDEDKFVGTWEREPPGVTYTFYSNGWCYINLKGEGEEWMKWELEDGKLFLYDVKEENVTCTDYSFSDNGKTLELGPKEAIYKIVLHKVE